MNFKENKYTVDILTACCKTGLKNIVLLHNNCSYSCQQCLVAKYCKIRKIYACEVCKFCIFLYYARKCLTTFGEFRPFCGKAFPCVIRKYTKFANFASVYIEFRPFCGKAFPCVIRKYTKFANFASVYIFRILQYFATKLGNFTNFNTLFLAVVKDFAFFLQR